VGSRHRCNGQQQYQRKPSPGQVCPPPRRPRWFQCDTAPVRKPRAAAHTVRRRPAVRLAYGSHAWQLSGRPERPL